MTASCGGGAVTLDAAPVLDAVAVVDGALGFLAGRRLVTRSEAQLVAAMVDAAAIDGAVALVQSLRSWAEHLTDETAPVLPLVDSLLDIRSALTAHR